ncbi:MAG TPA: hypothetical protein VFF72_12370 [Caldimonas sp.]|nr:hypothetical protein [Caldimonas sp.]
MIAATVLALAASLAACAAPSVSASASMPREVDVRIIVKLLQPSGDTAAIAADAARRAGVEVTYAAAVSGVWHALVLHCPDAAACTAATVRLRDSGAYADVEIDGRKRRAVM